MDGREDIYNLLLLICHKGDALWNHMTIYCCFEFVACLILMIGFIIIEVILNLTISQGSSSG